MTIFYYSARENGFFLAYDLDDCRKSELGLPDDLVEVSEEEHAALMNGQDAGRFIEAGENGRPVLRDRPALTPEQLAETANAEKKRLLAAANAAIAPLQDAADFGIATDEETALLLEWKKYRVLLNRVDTSTAPDIKWPVEPSAQAVK